MFDKVEWRKWQRVHNAVKRGRYGRVVPVVRAPTHKHLGKKMKKHLKRVKHLLARRASS